MQIAHIRNQFNLFGKKIGLIASFLLLFCSFNTFGQRVIKLPDYDTKKLHYGFQIGIFQTGLHLKRAQLSSDTLMAQSIWGGGFSVGFNMTFALQDELWSFRFLPNVAFYNREIDFGEANGKLVGESVVINIPLMLKYKAQRRRNSRMYMVAGLTPSYLVADNTDGAGNGIENLILQKTNLEISYGIGFDAYFQLFKF
ncbi:MAG: hypothetical protein ACI81T_001595, partial [Bacteroidia bacterium]